ncbi:hypothetical protein XCR1_2700016 [Xenorhabdus cabanillasii JM26]|uniref:Uncharacterized protein n=1 Tax=Xenorhabdus cabanillasii JM26 TaxID=1427517 RepID=W1J5P0_9GAMM|nr:hypothetical protein XCR1_2700016 [Xenorhabdus cabanillasii JM26]
MIEQSLQRNSEISQMTLKINNVWINKRPFILFRQGKLIY